MTYCPLIEQSGRSTCYWLLQRFNEIDFSGALKKQNNTLRTTKTLKEQLFENSKTVEVKSRILQHYSKKLGAILGQLEFMQDFKWKE